MLIAGIPFEGFILCVIVSAKSSHYQYPSVFNTTVHLNKFVGKMVMFGSLVSESPGAFFSYVSLLFKI